jgi:hypothetical protein
MSLSERRLDVLEARVALLESRFRELSRGDPDPPHTTDDRDRERLGHILRILKKLGGKASLDQIASHNSAITKAGTRAQLVRLIEIGDVIQPGRGKYALKEK